jgi:hypothetical protein
MAMEIRTSFASLRLTTNRIIELVSKMSGIDADTISISSAINNDLGIDGDDWIDLQLALQEKEGLTLDGLHFYDYFMDEGQIADSAGFIIGLIQFVWYIVSFMWLKKKFSQFYKPSGPQKDILTIGDLITSKFEGKFVKRTNRNFILV